MSDNESLNSQFTIKSIQSYTPSQYGVEPDQIPSAKHL